MAVRALPLPLPPPPALPAPAGPAPAPPARELADLCAAVYFGRLARRALDGLTAFLMSLVYAHSVRRRAYAAAPVRLLVRGRPAGSAGFRLQRTSDRLRPTAKDTREAFRAAFAPTAYAASHLEHLVRQNLQQTCDAVLGSGRAPPGAWVRVSRRVGGARRRRADPPAADDDSDGDDGEADGERPGAADADDGRPVPVAVGWVNRLRAMRRGLPDAPAVRAFADALEGGIQAARVVVADDLLGTGSRVDRALWQRVVVPDTQAWKAQDPPRWRAVAPAGSGLPERLLWALLLAYDGKRAADQAYEAAHARLAAWLCRAHRVGARTGLHAVPGGGTYVVGLRCPLPVAQYELDLLRAHAPVEYTRLMAGAGRRAGANAPFLAFASD